MISEPSEDFAHKFKDDSSVVFLNSKGTDTFEDIADLQLNLVDEMNKINDFYKVMY